MTLVFGPKPLNKPLLLSLAEALSDESLVELLR